MKKIITLIVSAIIAIVSVFTLTGCGKEKVVDVTSKGTITVGYTIYSPMNYKDDKGVLVGFDTELALMTFNALGYDVIFTEIEWSNKYNELNGNAVDCVWNGFTMNSTDKIDGVSTPRNQIVDFTAPYMYNAQCIVKGANAPEITSIADFANMSVAYEAGSAGESFVDSLTGAIKTPVTSQMDALREVKAGTADYAVVDVVLAKANAGKGDYASLSINEGLEMDQELYAVAFKKGSELTAKVNVMFDAFAKTGVLTELATKYGLQDVVKLNGYIPQ